MMAIFFTVIFSVEEPNQIDVLSALVPRKKNYAAPVPIFGLYSAKFKID
jgi:hypothetical protein